MLHRNKSRQVRVFLSSIRALMDDALAVLCAICRQYAYVGARAELGMRVTSRDHTREILAQLVPAAVRMIAAPDFSHGRTETAPSFEDATGHEAESRVPG